MTNFIPGSPTIGGIAVSTLQLIEQRVTNDILQEEMSNMHQDELKILRNDEAFGLGITPPVVPGN